MVRIDPDRPFVRFSNHSKLLMVANTIDVRFHSQHIPFFHLIVIGFPLRRHFDDDQCHICFFSLTWFFCFVFTLYNEIIGHKDTHERWFCRYFEPWNFHTWKTFLMTGSPNC